MKVNIKVLEQGTVDWINLAKDENNSIKFHFVFTLGTYKYYTITPAFIMQLARLRKMEIKENMKTWEAQFYFRLVWKLCNVRNLTNKRFRSNYIFWSKHVYFCILCIFICFDIVYALDLQYVCKEFITPFPVTVWIKVI